MRRAILMILANVEPADEAEFNRWYDREHMRERVDIPGFLSAQRWVSVDGARWKYLATYETEGLATFRSDVYRQALANQSQWSKAILTTFRDPQRCVAERTGRAGYGIAGTISLARLRPAPGMAERLRHLLSSEILPGIARRDGVIEASLLEADPSLSGPVAEYPKGGLDVIRPDDWFLLVGSGDRGTAGLDIAPAIEKDLAGTIESIGRFELLWDLRRTDLE